MMFRNYKEDIRSLEKSIQEDNELKTANPSHWNPRTKRAQYFIDAAKNADKDFLKKAYVNEAKKALNISDYDHVREDDGSIETKMPELVKEVEYKARSKRDKRNMGLAIGAAAALIASGIAATQYFKRPEIKLIDGDESAINTKCYTNDNVTVHCDDDFPLNKTGNLGPNPPVTNGNLTYTGNSNVMSLFYEKLSEQLPAVANRIESERGNVLINTNGNMSDAEWTRLEIREDIPGTTKISLQQYGLDGRHHQLDDIILSKEDAEKAHELLEDAILEIAQLGEELK